MPADQAPPAFSADFDIDARDLRQWLTADSQVRKQRVWTARMVIVFAIPASLLTVATVTVGSGLGACQMVPNQPPQTLVWLWTCNSSGSPSPGGQIWQETLWLTAAVLCWIGAVLNAVQAWKLTPARAARRWLRVAGGMYHVEVAADGITTVTPKGTTVVTPWSVLGAVHETDSAYLFLERDGQTHVGVPKRALPDPALAASLGEQLRAAIGQGSK